MWFGGSSAIISEICGRFIGVLCAITWVLLCEELTTSQIYHMFNGRSHGNYRKRRKYYTFEFKKRLHETHLKVPRKKLQESSCKWEQSQVYLSYLECSRHCLSKKDDSYCCLFLFIHRIIFYMCKRHVLPQIAQSTQRNTASCIISQRKTGCS